MKWWTYILLGIVWVGAVGVVLVVSLEGAKNVVAADLAADPNGLQVATAAVSSLVFGGPGFFFILMGIRMKRHGA
jgi:hypothetical protein